MTNLETRIAEALNDNNAKTSAYSDLLIEIEDALPLNAKEIEATRVRMVDPTYPNATIAKSALEKLELERDRLKAAVLILRQRYAQAERKETFTAIRPRYNELVAEHNECSETLGKLYHAFVESVVPLLAAAAKLNTDIRRMNAETHAKGLTEFPTIPMIGEHLIDKMVLPAGNDTANYWPDPKTANAVAVQWSDAIAQAYSSPLRQAASSPDWAAARALQEEAKKAEWARINALQERQQAEAKREFEQSKKVAR